MKEKHFHAKRTRVAASFIIFYAAVGGGMRGNMNVYNFKAEGHDGDLVDLKDFEGKVLLIINSATECGFTSQYDGLQDIFEKYSSEGFVILDFPCNQFGHQAPGTNEEIALFCDSRYGITFPIFSKIDVNGENATPLYRFLINQKGFEGFDIEHPLSSKLEGMLSAANPDYKNDPSIKWNFTKFLVDREGTVVERFEPTASMDAIEDKLKELL